ncbi:MAG: polyprenyl diphosphate synthase, partial [Oscillospiraceae bacterium]|nr:polyprenyl diphosphate synthase [Oscillospiraceae bacterium]
IGDRSVFKPDYLALMVEIEEGTKQKNGMILNVAINYGGRDEIIHAVRGLAQQVKEGALQPQDITEKEFSDYLYTAGQPDPDFILRPSGEKRLSNFLIWQSSYAEFVYQDVLWPDFTRENLDQAIEEYCARSRRFGGI